MEKRKVELAIWQHFIIFSLCAVCLTLRLPGTIFHAQFWAEDGRYWYAGAYNSGWWLPLFKTQDGYFQTFPRLAAALSLLVPLSHAPAVLNILAIGVRAIPVNIILSDRCSGWGGLGFRILLATIYVTLPNCREISSNATNSQWILALCLFLILGAAQPRSHLGRCFDIGITLLCGLTGPFCIFLFPIALYWAWKRKRTWHWILAALLGSLCLIQAYGLFSGYAERPHPTLGVGAILFMRILGSRIFLSTLIGAGGLSNHPAILAQYPDMHAILLLIGVIVVSLALMIFCLVEAANEMRLFIVFSAILLGVSLISSTTYPPEGVTAWEMLANAESIRYWFFPSLAFAWSVAWGIRSAYLTAKLISWFLLCILCTGIYHDWRFTSLPDKNFQDNVRKFEASPSGTEVHIPINPTPWDMMLKKH